MNVLVTNTFRGQAYFIIRSLRPHARRIVATMSGTKPFQARLACYAANSRLVDRRYFIPSPVNDWFAGNLQRENTPGEENYIKSILQICEKEQIDTVFPSWDPHVYLFAKNKERLEKAGILVPVPDYDTVMDALDKYKTIRKAEEAGFPCPKTYLAESDDDLKRISAEVGFPLMIRPRFTAESQGMDIASNVDELLQKVRRISAKHGIPMIQEYIPGREKLLFFLILDRDGDLKSVFFPKVLRVCIRMQRDASAACESAEPHPIYHVAAKVARNLGWWGAVTFQAKVDARDQLPKFIEINGRLGTTLWYRTELGINEPWICLKIARGETVQAAAPYPVGTLLLEPVEDVMRLCFNLLDLVIYKFRVNVQGKTPLDPLYPPNPIGTLVASYAKTYLNRKKKVFNPYFRYFFEDPLVSILWWYRHSKYYIRNSAQIGK